MGLTEADGPVVSDERFVNEIAWGMQVYRAVEGVHGLVYVHNACQTRLEQGAGHALQILMATLIQAKNVSHNLDKVAHLMFDTPTYNLTTFLSRVTQSPVKPPTLIYWDGPLLCINKPSCSPLPAPQLPAHSCQPHS